MFPKTSRSLGTGYASAILGVAAVTAICDLLRSHINEVTAALAMLLIVLSVAALWERGPALVASVLGMLCLNYFFLPPAHTFTIAGPENWIALGAFLATALAASHFSALARRRATEAEAGRSQAGLSTAYNRSLLEASLYPLVTIGHDGKINDVNAAAETLTGHSRSELIGSEFSEHFTEAAKARAAYERVFRDGSVRSCPLELRHPRGHSTSILFDGSLYRDAGGNAVGVVAAARPIGTYMGRPLEIGPDPRVVRRLNFFAGFASLVAVAVGLLSLAGLTFRIAVLKSIVPGQPVIKMNAAVCLVLLGLSLWLARTADQQPHFRIKRLCGRIAAGITALVGLLSLTENLFGWRLGIDQLLFREPPADVFVRVRPGLMAPITALDFLLLGLGLLLLDRAISWRSRPYWPAQYFASLTAILSIVGLLDFVLGSHTSYTHMALQTAATLLLLSVSLLCVRTERGMAAMLASSAEGGVLTRRLLPAAVIVPIAIGALSWNALTAGLRSEWSALSLIVVAMIALLGAFAIWNGYIVNRGDLERRRGEEALHRREMELREAERLAHVGSWWWDPKTDSVTWSAGLSHLTRRDPMLPPPAYDEHLGVYTAQSSARLGAAVQRAIQTGASFELDLEMVRADGAIRSVTGRGEAERDAGGRVVLVRGTIQDITERKQAEGEIRLLARLQGVVAELGQKALRRDESDTVPDEAVSLVAQALDVEYCKVLALLPDGQSLLLRAGVGWKQGLVGRATVGSGADSQAGFTLHSDGPVLVEDLRTEKRFSGLPLLHEHDVVSGVSVIISTSAGPYGVLGAHTRKKRTFTNDEVTFLQSVANVLGTMVERRRAEEALLRSNRAQRALSSCNYALIRATDESTLLQEVCRIIVQETGYRFCWVGYAEPDQAKTVRPLAHAGLEEGYLKTVNITWADTERGRGPTGTCIRTGKTQAGKDFTMDPRLAPWRSEALKRGYLSALAIPLEVDSKPFGALSIYSSETEAFGAGEVDLLTELASDLGYGITVLHTRAERQRAEEEIRTLNAELEQRVIHRTAELRAANQELEQAREREIEIGFRIQQTLLFDQPPQNVPGLQIAALTIPSLRIAGDFYIFLRHSQKCLDMIVGDVMGKGIPAALLGAATKSQFLRALSDLTVLSKDGKIPEPREIVMLAHAELAPHLIELDSFVTLCYARLDLARRSLALVDCGHTGIIHRHGRTGRCEMLHGDNLPLGVREGEIYDQISVPFEPGDLLLFFSDGITEARNSSGELFGAERLQHCVASNRRLEPGALVEAIRKAVLAFSESNRLADDLTTVAVGVDEGQLPIARAEIEIGSDLKYLRQAREFVLGFCRGLPGEPLDEDSTGALELAVNEAASNIMRHAYQGHSDRWIHLEAEAFQGHVSIRLHHLGGPFDPSAAASPALDGSRESGFGTYIISKSVDEVRYQRDEHGRNCIVLEKFRKSPCEATKV